MSEYKKKKVKSKVKPRKKLEKAPSSEIKMQPRINRPQQRPTKPKKNNPITFKIRGMVVSASILIVFVACYLITYLLHPVGVLEYLGTSLSTVGTGKYPLSLYGGDALQVTEKSNTYLVLSETHVDIFNNHGKSVFSEQHGFLQPVLKTSDVRNIVYDQGGKSLKLFNNDKMLNSKKYNNEIISVGIAKNGTYAVATRSDGYQSQIIVTDKNEKKVFEWYCADETINNVALTNNGKTLIISALKVENGAFKSTVYVLDYNLASPLYTFQYEDVIVSIEANGNNKAILAFSDKIEFLNLKNGKTVTSKDNYKINHNKMYWWHRGRYYFSKSNRGYGCYNWFFN